MKAAIFLCRILSIVISSADNHLEIYQAFSNRFLTEDPKGENRALH